MGVDDLESEADMTLAVSLPTFDRFLFTGVFTTRDFLLLRLKK